MGAFSVKVLTPGRGLSIKEFSTHPERAEWLRANGFYESSGIYRHLNGSTAGIFTNTLDQLQIALRCDKPLAPKRFWSGNV